MAMVTFDGSVTTVEQLLALPEDGVRHELLRGEHVMTPGPGRNHQRVQIDLLRQLVNFVWPLAHLELYDPPSDILLDADTLVQPDLVVLRLDPENPPADWPDRTIPELVIEILSPGTATRDRGAKRTIYQEAGVSEYWIVDIDSRLVERWTPEDDRPEILREKITWRPDKEGETLTIDLKELFGRLPAQPRGP